ncbi:unnamed protein product, partial [Prorocentrum cordatum]
PSAPHRGVRRPGAGIGRVCRAGTWSRGGNAFLARRPVLREATAAATTPPHATRDGLPCPPRTAAILHAGPARWRDFPQAARGEASGHALRRSSRLEGPRGAPELLRAPGPRPAGGQEMSAGAPAGRSTSSPHSTCCAVEHTERPRAPSQGMHETPSKHGEHHALARTAQSCRRAPVRSVPAGAPAVAPGSPSQALQGNRRAELPYLIILLACRIKSRCGILEGTCPTEP